MFLPPEDIVMKRIRRFIGLILFFGLCIIMLSKVTDVYAADSVKLNVKSISIIKGGVFKLKAYNTSEGQTVLYRSSDTDIATVSKSGVVKGVSCGSATVTATVLEDGVAVATLQCEVQVGPAAVSIKFTKSELVLQVGRMKTIKTIIAPINTVEEPVFFSTNTDIATVSAAGRVRAKEVGVVQIYAFLMNGKIAECNVVVLDEKEYENYLSGKSLEEILVELENDISEEDVPEDDPESEITVDEIPDIVAEQIRGLKSKGQAVYIAVMPETQS